MKITCSRTPFLSKSGFTLIELLVVVLIIGVLAAVALPQYNKAVEKSKIAEGITLAKAVGQAAQAYYLTNGVLPTSFDQLDIDLPSVEVPSYDSNKASNFFAGGAEPSRLVSQDWAVYLRGDIVVLRLSGKYAYAGGFAFEIGKNWLKDGQTISPHTLWCISKSSLNYCNEMLNINSTSRVFSRGSADYYYMK